MIFYDGRVTFECLIGDVPFDMARNVHRIAMRDNNFWDAETIQGFNSALFDNEESDEIAMLIYEARRCEFGVVIATNSMERTNPAVFIRAFKRALKELLLDDDYNIFNLKVKTLKEIAPAQAYKLICIADNRNRYTSYTNNWFRNGILGDDDFSFNFLRCNEFSAKDRLFEGKILTKKAALDMAKQLMLDKTFTDEIERIYSKAHPKKFAGIPIHYALKVHNSQGVRQMAELLCRALYANNRVVGRCINRISKITEDAYDDNDLESVFKQAVGNTLIVEMRGSNEEHANYASCYYRVVNYFSSLIKKYQHRVQFILVEESVNPGFAPKLISRVQDELQLVELKEGAGNRSVALAYLKNLAAENGLVSYSDEDFERALGDRLTFRPSDVVQIYENLSRDNLRNNVYTSYKNVSLLRIANDRPLGNDAYQRLHEMIGLTAVKNLLDEILAHFKVQKARSSAGLNQQKLSRHMVFTGNPGTAKTTVARLFAQILAKEGVLDSGSYVECGRADLIGEYVGQTAPRVRGKFNEARGGILMIDEAYSLMDDYRNGYGDEAIGAIVQEMENRREDTIVIFCGYPDKMKSFLKVNEGLRSRIAFHIDFADYSADELVEILRLFVKNDGYEISAEIEEKCRKIFAGACKKKDFGNGRFVRNIWEQAKLHQSSRICRENSGRAFEREVLLQLKPEDFDVLNAAEKFGKDDRTIGFARK